MKTTQGILVCVKIRIDKQICSLGKGNESIVIHVQHNMPCNEADCFSDDAFTDVYHSVSR